MAEVRLSGVACRGRRRWSFAGCVFDEANWTLTVDGLRVSVEAKPLILLRELLLRAGHLLSKDELMDSIWPDVEVVEASLPTAVGKLRRVLQDDRRDRPIIETVPRLGYRLAVPVAVDELVEDQGGSAGALQPVNAPSPQGGELKRRVSDRPGRQSRLLRLLFIVGALAMVSALIAWGTGLPKQGATTITARSSTQRDVFTALRKLDVEAIERFIAAGWNPNASLDSDRNSAMNVLLGVCEWDPAHDQRRLLLAARTLVDAGQSLTVRNAWGDTPYSIAKAQRYCGPNHPVTKMIWALCISGPSRDGSACLSDYRREVSGTVLRQ